LSTQFPFYEFSGSNREIGRQHGQLAGDLVHQHLNMALGKLEAKGVDHAIARERARLYIPFIEKHAPHFAEELTGLAEGAEFSVEDAYILQLRAELAVAPDEDGTEEAAMAREVMAHECTTFAISGKHTADGVPIAGQNADLPAGTRDVGIVMSVRPDNHPSLLMLTPAGQISYIGINDQGMSVFANFLNTGNWRAGFPRYLLSRSVLEHDSISAALARLSVIPRASSRNVLMMERSGNSVDIEMAVEREARIEPQDGVLAHSNHFVAEELHDCETSTPDRMNNSCLRLDRMTEMILADSGTITPERTMEYCRDRENAPDAICRHHGDGPADYITFASVIARPSRGEMWVAVGPPDQYDYTRYSFDS
jgi:isopenicillin-N N-acyltransferase like protein